MSAAAGMSGQRGRGGLVGYLGDVATLTGKDLRIEWRARDTFPAMALFVLSTMTIFHFALPSGSSERAAQGMLWVAILFTALLGLTRTYAPEREQGMFDGLLLSPVDRSAIWLAKVLARALALYSRKLSMVPVKKFQSAEMLKLVLLPATK